MPGMYFGLRQKRQFRLTETRVFAGLVGDCVLRNRILNVLAAMLFSSGLSAENIVLDLGPNDTIVVERHQTDVKVDGKLDEPVWQQLPAYADFVVVDPDTLAKPIHQTRVRLFYDDSALYVGVDMDQPQDTLVARLSGRDARRLNRDGVSLTLDTSGEGRYGYWFGVNLGGSLTDGTVLPERQFSSDWDGAWWGESEVTGTGWSAEFRIPWGTVTMPKTRAVRRIGLYMSRKLAYLNERWGWPGLPPTIPKFMSALQILEVTGVDPKQQFSVYPFLAVTDDQIENNVDYRIGADVFWRPSTNFQVTATVNPDFGVVEADNVVINLTALETFFPEKRLFFLEGQEVFVASPRADTRGGGVGTGAAPTTLVNTKRIGGKPFLPTLAPGVAISKRETNQPVDLLGALKLTGQLGRIRYGILGAFEDDLKLNADLDGTPVRIEAKGSNYGIARIIYEDVQGGAYRAIGFLSTAAMHPDRDAVTYGADGHYLSEDGKWKIDGQTFMSEIEGTDTGYGGFVDFEYTFRQGLTQRLGVQYLDDSIDINDLGFLQRNDNFQIRSAHTRTSPNLTWARDNQLDVRGLVQRNGKGLFTGGGLFFSNRLTLDNLSSLTLRAGFLPESYDDLNSFGNGTFRTEERKSVSIGWDSDSSKKLSFGLSAGFREEDLGGDTVVGNAKLIWRPSDRFGFKLDIGYRNRNGWLLHQEDRNFTTFQSERWSPTASAEYYINARQQFRISLDWIGIKAREDQFFLIPREPGDLIPTEKPPGPTDNFSFSQISLQARYRWEIAPLSDIFVVYTRLADGGAALGDMSFSDIFSDSYDAPLQNMLVFKIRYRLGS